MLDIFIPSANVVRWELFAGCYFAGMHLLVIMCESEILFLNKTELNIIHEKVLLVAQISTSMHFADQVASITSFPAFSLWYLRTLIFNVISAYS